VGGRILLGDNTGSLSGSSELDFVLQLDCFVYATAVNKMHTQFRAAPDLPQRAASTA
jgi:hypothetical protein